MGKSDNNHGWGNGNNNIEYEVNNNFLNIYSTEFDNSWEINIPLNDIKQLILSATLTIFIYPILSINHFAFKRDLFKIW